MLRGVVKGESHVEVDRGEPCEAEIVEGKEPCLS